MKKNYLLAAGVVFCAVFAGCVQPRPQLPPPGGRVDVDSVEYGISSQDVRNLATQMCPGVLSVPELGDADDRTLVAISDFTNSSRLQFDRNIFMKRLIAELNRYSRGKVRFINNNVKVNRDRVRWTKQRQEKERLKNMKKIAAEIAAVPVLKNKGPVKVAVLPVINTNVVNMNGESFLAMIRSDISRASGRNIQFMLPGTMDGADYYLAGQFIPESIKAEGIINLANYIEAVDCRVKNGQSMYVVSQPFVDFTPTQITSLDKNNTSITTVSPAMQRISLFENHLKKIFADSRMQESPDVNKYLNVIIVDAKSKASVYEERFLIEGKVSDNAEAARFIISGEISALSKRINNRTVDYVMISVQLTDMESNAVVWEDVYEVKMVTPKHNSVVYQ